MTDEHAGLDEIAEVAKFLNLIPAVAVYRTRIIAVCGWVIAATTIVANAFS